MNVTERLAILTVSSSEAPREAQGEVGTRDTRPGTPSEATLVSTPDALKKPTTDLY